MFVLLGDNQKMDGSQALSSGTEYTNRQASPVPLDRGSPISTRSDGEQVPLDGEPILANLTFLPDPAEYSAPVNMTVDAYGSSPITSVWFEISYPNGTYDWGSMDFLQAQTYGSTFDPVGLGEHQVVVHAHNELFLENTTSGSFWVNDTTPPSIWGGVVHWLRDVNTSFYYFAFSYDNHRVEGAWANITAPDGQPFGNLTLACSHDFGCSAVLKLTEFGNYIIELWANDTSDNWGHASDTIEVVDSLKPQLLNATAYPDPQEVHFSTNISVEISDNDVVKDVWIMLEDPNGTTSNLSVPLGQDYLDAVYDVIGNYSFRIFALDGCGNLNSTSGWFWVVDTTSPSANAGSDAEAFRGSTFRFDASASYDNYKIESYRWTFLDHGENVTLQGSNPAYTFDGEGRYEITLTVTDTSGNEDTDVIIIEVKSDIWYDVLLYSTIAALVVPTVTILLFLRKRRLEEA